MVPKQGQTNGHPSRVGVGRGCVEKKLCIQAGAALPKIGSYKQAIDNDLWAVDNVPSIVVAIAHQITLQDHVNRIRGNDSSLQD